MRTIDIKALIVKDGKFLMLKERNTKSDEWDIPGARLGKQKASATLLSAVKKECNLKVDIIKPVMMSSYTSRGKKIYVMVFLCRYLSGKIRLDRKYDSFKWADTKSVKPARDDEIIDMGIG